MVKYLLGIIYALLPFLRPKSDERLIHLDVKESILTDELTQIEKEKKDVKKRNSVNDNIDYFNKSK